MAGMTWIHSFLDRTMCDGVRHIIVMLKGPDTVGSLCGTLLIPHPKAWGGGHD